MYGGSAFLFYQVTIDLLRHHDELNNRPKIIDHCATLGIIGGAAGALSGSGSIYRVWQFWLFTTVMVGPITWWLKLNGLHLGSSHK